MVLTGRQCTSQLFKVFIILLAIMVLLPGSGVALAREAGVDQGKFHRGEDPPPDRSPTLRHGRIHGGDPLAASPGASVLVDQLNNPGDWGIVSEKFDPVNSEWDAEAADDFVIPEGDGAWTIETIDVYGLCRNLDFEVIDCGNLDSANIRFYRNNGTIPGEEVYSASQEDIIAGGLVQEFVRMYSVDLTTPAVLPAGRYWVSFQVNMDISAGDFAVNERTVQSGYSYAFRNPGGAWGTGCTDWCGGGGYDPDLNFRLTGIKANPNKTEVSTGDVYALVEHHTQPRLYVSVPASNLVRVVDASTASVLTSINVGSTPRGLAISPDSSQVFVALSGGSAIKVIDTATNAVVDTFVLTYTPQEVVYGGLGRLFVSEDGGTIHSLNPSTGVEVGTLPSSVRAGEILAISPDGNTLCSGASGVSPASVACYDVSVEPSPAPDEKFNIGSNLHTLDISADNSLLYAACGSPYQITAFYLSTLSQSGTFPTGAYPESGYDSLWGDKVFISGGDSSWLWSATLYTKIRILDHDEVRFLAAGRDNFTAYGTYGGNLVIYQYTTFRDLPWTHWARRYIEALYNSGLTGGCSADPLLYCPENTVTRAQMAVFLENGIHYPNPYSPPDMPPSFGDTAGHWAEDWIEALYSDGITAGCGGGNYCPNAGTTRAQMAIFLLKSKYGSSYTPPDVPPTFGDTAGHWAQDWIAQLAAEGITAGCGGGNYCPNNSVTRAQMAVFLTRTFNLPLP